MHDQIHIDAILDRQWFWDGVLVRQPFAWDVVASAPTDAEGATVEDLRRAWHDRRAR